MVVQLSLSMRLGHLVLYAVTVTSYVIDESCFNEADPDVLFKETVKAINDNELVVVKLLSSCKNKHYRCDDNKQAIAFCNGIVQALLYTTVEIQKYYSEHDFLGSQYLYNWVNTMIFNHGNKNVIKDIIINNKLAAHIGIQDTLLLAFEMRNWNVINLIYSDQNYDIENESIIAIKDEFMFLRTAIILNHGNCPSFPLYNHKELIGNQTILANIFSGVFARILDFRCENIVSTTFKLLNKDTHDFAIATFVKLNAWKLQILANIVSFEQFSYSIISSNAITIDKDIIPKLNVIGVDSKLFISALNDCSQNGQVVLSRLHTLAMLSDSISPKMSPDLKRLANLISSGDLVPFYRVVIENDFTFLLHIKPKIIEMGNLIIKIIKFTPKYPESLKNVLNDAISKPLSPLILLNNDYLVKVAFYQAIQKNQETSAFELLEYFQNVDSALKTLSSLKPQNGNKLVDRLENKLNDECLICCYPLNDKVFVYKNCCKSIIHKCCYSSDVKPRYGSKCIMKCSNDPLLDITTENTERDAFYYMLIHGN